MAGQHGLVCSWQLVAALRGAGKSAGITGYRAKPGAQTQPDAQ